MKPKPASAIRVVIADTGMRGSSMVDLLSSASCDLERFGSSPANLRVARLPLQQPIYVAKHLITACEDCPGNDPEELCDCALSSWLARTLRIERESEAAWALLFRTRNERLRLQARREAQAR